MSEYYTHLAVCRYLSLQYPDVIFFSDGSGLRLTKGLATKVKGLKSERGIPDLFICKPSGDYHGLFIEVKKEGTRLYKKNGEGTTPHIREQMEIIKRLQEAGYYAAFGSGFNECKALIDLYINLKP